MRVRVQMEAMAAYPFPETRLRLAPRFSSAWSTTQALMHRELNHLMVPRSPVAALRLVTSSQNFRLDGGLRANARIEHPGAVLSFESKYGPLEFYCDRYSAGNGIPGWQQNVRAIALAMEALRRVDRYGVGGTGQQYAGWRAIEAAPTGLAAAEARLREIAEARPETPLNAVLRLARAKAHPDRHSGHRELWDEVEKLAATLGLL